MSRRGFFYQFGGHFEPPTSPDICTKMTFLTFSYLVNTNYLMFSHIIPIGPHKVHETGKRSILLKFQGFKNYKIYKNSFLSLKLKKYTLDSIPIIKKIIVEDPKLKISSRNIS